MKTLVVIPARKGSKGFPKKNLKKLNNKPLIAYTIEAAKECLFEEEICITTDDRDIADLATSYNLPPQFLRPPHLSSDTASMIDVLKHCVEFYENKEIFFKTLILLQPTSPFRTSEHIKDAMALYEQEEIDMLVSVKETKANPYFNLFEQNQKGYLVKSKRSNHSRRQDVPKVYEYNGAIYIINVDALKKVKSLDNLIKVKKYVMSSLSSIDIDNELDWILADQIAKRIFSET